MMKDVREAILTAYRMKERSKFFGDSSQKCAIQKSQYQKVVEKKVGSSFLHVRSSQANVEKVCTLVCIQRLVNFEPSRLFRTSSNRFLNISEF